MPIWTYVIGTSPERPQVDSYIVFRHLSETVPCRCPHWMDLIILVRRVCACMWTGRRRLEYYSINPPDPCPPHFLELQHLRDVAFALLDGDLGVLAT